MTKKSLFLFFVFITSFFSSIFPKLPEIQNHDVSSIMKEILDSHASYKTLNATIIKRAFVNYLEIIDPKKTYLLISEVEPWINPSEKLLKTTLSQFDDGIFTAFESMHELMLKAIKRRNEFENDQKELSSKPVSTDELRDLKWAEDTQKLKERLLKIKSLQLEVMEKIDTEEKDLILRRIAKRRRHFESDYLEKNTLKRKRFIFSNILKACTSALDTHTAYFTPDEATSFMINVQKRLFGIGVALRDDLNGLTITNILEGGPTDKSKLLRVKDRIIAVDGKSILGLEIHETVELIRGESGTTVHLTIIRESEDKENAKKTSKDKESTNKVKKQDKLEVKIVRGEVVLTETRFDTSFEPFGDGAIANVKLYSFYQDPQFSSAEDIQKELLKIQKKTPLKGVILDLRQNSGGMLPQAIAVSGLFINKGIVVSIKDSSGNIQHLRNMKNARFSNIPLVVLVSKVSASASEIVAQCLQDYGRAIILGDESSFGKGTFQTFTLDTSHNGKVNPRGEYKVTRGKYYTVSGKTPQLTGVIPDIVIPGTTSLLEIGEKHAKYPLENDTITSHFNDDLADLPLIQRIALSRSYQSNLQKVSTKYTQFLPLLRKNLQLRMDNNDTYNFFLKELKKETPDIDLLNEYNREDLQLQESIKILKDLIILKQEENLAVVNF